MAEPPDVGEGGCHPRSRSLYRRSEAMSKPDEPGSPRSSWRTPILSAAAGVVAVALVVVGVVVATAGDDEPAPAANNAESAEPVPAPEGQPAVLPASTTHDTIDTAPLDQGLDATDGSVVHPREEMQVHDAPAGTPFARIGPQQVGDTWLPVIAEQPGWVQVLLPSKPNGSTGWLAADGLDRAVTPYLILVHLESRTLELHLDGQPIGEWPAGIGKSSAPTPPGRTFLLGSFSDPQQDYSPVILPLGTHSPTLDTFGGGPGTVAIHTWPTDDAFGAASSDGCIRVPQDALDQLTEVPLGTLVLIDQL